MILRVTRFMDVMLVALLTGTMFGILIGDNPMQLTAGAYIEQQQTMIRGLNTLMPLLGLLTIVMTLASAYLHRMKRPALAGLVVAAVLLIVSGVITRFFNQPINSIVMTWNPQVPPPEWMQLREQWWSYHVVRTAACLLALALIAWNSVRGEDA